MKKANSRHLLAETNLCSRLYITPLTLSIFIQLTQPDQKENKTRETKIGRVSQRIVGKMQNGVPGEFTLSKRILKHLPIQFRSLV